MKTHIVAIFDHFIGKNKLHCVIAENEVLAVKKAIIEDYKPETPTEDYKNWINSLGETLEDVLQNAEDKELYISNVLTI